MFFFLSYLSYIVIDVQGEIKVLLLLLLLLLKSAVNFATHFHMSVDKCD